MLKQMKKTRTEVFIETNETYIIKRKRFFVRTWCKSCDQEVSMIPPAEAALLICRDTKTIYSLIEQKHLHYCFPEAETPFVCLRSLSFI